jgi:hypothetical protein
MRLDLLEHRIINIDLLQYPLFNKYYEKFENNKSKYLKQIGNEQIELYDSFCLYEETGIDTFCYDGLFMGIDEDDYFVFYFVSIPAQYINNVEYFTKDEVQELLSRKNYKHYLRKLYLTDEIKEQFITVIINNQENNSF